MKHPRPTSTNAVLMIPVLAFSFLPFAGFGQSDDGRVTTSVQRIAPAELQDMLETTKVFVYDCNEDFIYEEMHVPGATLIVYDQVSEEVLPEDRGATLAFYCYSPECPAGEMAAKSAMELGYTNVLCMHAGITGWQDAGLVTEP